MTDYINKKSPFFYILDKRDNSKWEVVEIDDSKTGNRLGWLNCICYDIGVNDKNVLGGVSMGIDAAFVFLSDYFDYSKIKF